MDDPKQLHPCGAPFHPIRAMRFDLELSCCSAVTQERISATRLLDRLI